jgi:hypothetical protein
MSIDTTDWTQLREFAGVDIARSYALSWEVESRSLFIDLDLFLKEEHPFYEKSRPAEKACFRPAILEFPECTAIRIPGRGDKLSPIDSAVDIDPGQIEGLTRTGEGQYEIRGDFGSVAIASDRPLLRLKDLT